MLISLIGPSGVGKGYTKDRIKRRYPHMRELVWATTRPLRNGEAALGTNRRSISLEQIAALHAGNGVADEQILYGHTYVLTRDEVARTVQELCITETHIERLSKVRASVPGMISIALVPESHDLLRKRLLFNRQAADNADTAKRLEAAHSEIKQILARASEFSLVVTMGEENETQVARIIEFLSTAVGANS